MALTKGMKIVLGLVVAAVVAGVITVIVLAVKSGSASNNPSGLSSDGQYAVGQRQSDDKWQVIYVQNTTTPFEGLYQILYNPQTSSDASMTNFATADAANDYKTSNWSQLATPTNKALTPLSARIASMDYKNITTAKSNIFSPAR